MRAFRERHQKCAERTGFETTVPKRAKGRQIVQTERVLARICSMVACMRTSSQSHFPELGASIPRKQRQDSSNAWREATAPH
eukprot:5842061-Pleurochrysis_carterae.AAC.4